jgi:very-short-patch-repair endonuclease
MADAGDIPGPTDQDRRQRELAALAARQLGVVSRADLYELGFTYEQGRTMVRQGRLHPLHRDVFAVGHRRIVDRGLLLAGLMAVGRDAFLSHRTAAGVWGLRAINTHDIEVTVVGSSARRRPGLMLHRTKDEPHPRDVRQNGHLRVSSVLRLLVELSPRETPAELERLVTVAVQRRLLRPDLRSGLTDIEETLARHERWPGLGTLRAVLAVYRRTDSSKSGLERAFDRVLAAHPEFPEPERNVHIDRWEIDRFWPQYKLVVELDGRPYHIAARDMERDRVKDAALQRLGLIPLRFTDFRVEHDLPGIVTDLRHFLATGG